jgi:hypothetical protein
MAGKGIPDKTTFRVIARIGELCAGQTGHIE